MPDRPATDVYRPSMPYHMVWLSTNACNARCLHCSSASSTRSADELRTDEVIDLIDQLADAGVVDLAVSGGEPLLRGDLFEILLHARMRGLSTGVGTNGGNLSDGQAKRLAATGILRLQVSLDGLRETHDALRAWPGLFDRALRSIAVARRAGLRVHVCCTIHRGNVSELDAFAPFVRDLGVRRINFSRYIPTGRGTDALDVSDGEWREVIHRCAALRRRHAGEIEIVTHLAQQIIVDDEVVAMPGFIGCQAGIGQGCVTANGTVTPCVLLPIGVGNVRAKRFADIWKSSPVIRTLRERAALGGACGSCALRARCGGCRAVAFAKTGDFLATDPRCWLPGVPAPQRGAAA